MDACGRGALIAVSACDVRRPGRVCVTLWGDEHSLGLLCTRSRRPATGRAPRPLSGWRRATAVSTAPDGLESSLEGGCPAVTEPGYCLAAACGSWSAPASPDGTSRPGPGRCRAIPPRSPCHAAEVVPVARRGHATHTGGSSRPASSSRDPPGTCSARTESAARHSEPCSRCTSSRTRTTGEIIDEKALLSLGTTDRLYCRVISPASGVPVSSGMRRGSPAPYSGGLRFIYRRHRPRWSTPALHRASHCASTSRRRGTGRWSERKARATSGCAAATRRTRRPSLRVADAPGKAATCGHGCSLLRVNIGRVSSAALMLSGLVSVVTPKRVGAALELVPSSARGVAETRSLGGTYAAFGVWALFSGEPAADVAVGVIWLGAGGARLASLLVDRPRANATFWAYLALELGLGATSLMSASLRRQENEIRSDDPGTTFRDLQPEG